MSTTIKEFFSDWFGLVFYAVSTGLLLFVIIHFIMNEDGDNSSHNERYRHLIEKVENLAKDSPEAEHVNDLYQQWLYYVQTRVTWRVSAFIAVIIGFILTLFGFAVFSRGYECLKISASPPFFFLIASIFCFFMVSGLLNWLSFHNVRPSDEYYIPSYRKILKFK